MDYTAIDASPDGILVVLLDGTIARANEEAGRLFGRDVAALIGMPIDELIPQRVRGRHRDHMAAFLARPVVRPMCTTTDVRGVRSDGREVALEISLIPALDGDRRVVVATLRDESRRPLTLRSLATFMDLAPDAMLAVNRAGQIVAANVRAEALLGRLRAGLIGQPLGQLLPAEVRNRHSELLAGFFADPKTRAMGEGRELVALRGDGALIPVEISLAPATTDRGMLAVAALRDVSDRRATIARLRASEQQLGDALAMAKMGVWRLDLTADRRMYSSSLLGLLGLGDAHASSADFYAHVHPDDCERVRNATQAAVERGEGYTLELRMRVEDGRYRWFATHVRVERDDKGNPASLVGIARDIDEERRAREAVNESRALLDAVLRTAPDVICYLDLAGRVRFINRTADSAQHEGMVGRPWTDLLESDDAERASAALSAAASGGETVELDVNPRGVRERTWAVRLQAERVEGTAVGIVATCRDVTDARRLSGQLAATERLATLGTMSASIAHELNNPLAAVLAEIDFLQERFSQSKSALDDARESLGNAREACERLRAIVTDLKVFAHPDAAATDVVDLGSVLQSSLRLASNELRHRASVQADIGELPRVFGNANRLGQVFLNLLVNAAQAVSEQAGARGLVSIAAETAPDREHVIVTVRDNGPGISPVVMQRLFTPFTTTKKVGSGTGLGLAICHRIVSDSGGRIEASNVEPHGAEFRVTLRVSEEPERRAASTRQSEPRQADVSRRARVLLLDDDASVLRSTSRMLRSHYEVETFNDPTAALERLGSAPAIDVVLSDLVMPTMTGSEFYERLIEQHPHFAGRVVFASGGAFTEEAQTFASRTDVAFLAKPYSRSDAIRAIEAIGAVAAVDPSGQKPE